MKFIPEEARYWKTNHEWYGIDKEFRYYLKDAAPPKARESFQKYCEVQGYPKDNRNINKE